jgi:UDP-N-acetylmuramate--alanine ligase
MEKKIHFMGISGSGASAVANLARKMGYEVTGCDEEKEGHSTSHLQDIDFLCVSPAVFYLNNDNEEMEFARDNKIPIMTWQKFMGEVLFKDKFTIAVAGTHGKTTTTGLTGFLMENAGLNPWVEVGGVVKNWNKNYRIGSSKYFICEADEFYDNFLNIHADIILLNNIEFDHPEFFKTEEKMYESFVKFINNAKPNAKLIVNIDNVGMVKFMSVVGVRFPRPMGGVTPPLRKIRKDIEIIQFDNSFINDNHDIFKNLQIFGAQNVKNAAGVLKLAEILNISLDKVKKAFGEFQGMKRRMDLIGETHGIKIYDDYAHHPTAIHETISAFRGKYPQEKITVVIQPHTYSRLKYLFEDFKTCADAADLVIYTDVFASREKGKPTVSSSDLVTAISKTNVRYVPYYKLIDYLEENNKNKIVVFMGAGNINNTSQMYLCSLRGFTAAEMFKFISMCVRNSICPKK